MINYIFNQQSNLLRNIISTSYRFILCILFIFSPFSQVLYALSLFFFFLVLIAELQISPMCKVMLSWKSILYICIFLIVNIFASQGLRYAPPLSNLGRLSRNFRSSRFIFLFSAAMGDCVQSKCV